MGLPLWDFHCAALSQCQRTSVAWEGGLKGAQPANVEEMLPTQMQERWMGLAQAMPQSFGFSSELSDFLARRLLQQGDGLCFL